MKKNKKEKRRPLALWIAELSNRLGDLEGALLSERVRNSERDDWFAGILDAYRKKEASCAEQMTRAREMLLMLAGATGIDIEKMQWEEAYIKLRHWITTRT